ncbi:Predicted DNA-binding transcriptional regulator YafY, contains an HTH and WYL domains [Nocardioides scoriae]|uniref:Predicted DNA-binding transcriptional regulator YafY, contains an HTH and WYL domains n=1 Tax=Nocardioides scoriae TaxID=642780 RepID=A0A1H1LBA9_9ACTN|nr:WYL domain-containing protein [Nocardioides scoriae]SDR71612.1 Predicted DNA-binding transcriptional regulator YafY, contains an HTH and WYL domains [Nocardioides scoriae]
MADGTPGTPGRLLTLLSLLQTPREWPGPELARRLEVSERTVRNDVERLRQLGYPVHASRGAAGGYRLAAGQAMPPLLLDDEEAVAVAVALGASQASVVGMEETSLRALTKLLQVLPTRLRGQVDALRASTVRAAPRRRGPEVAGALLADLASCIRDREVVRFGYADHTGAATERRAEPYRLVSLGQRWYLVAHDLGRDDWRTFRVDRVRELRGVGHRFRPRELPAEDLAAYVAQRTRSVQQQVTGVVVLEASAASVEERMGWWTTGSIEVLGQERCRVRIAGRSTEDVAFWVGALGVDFTAEGPPELLEAVRAVERRYGNATRGDGGYTGDAQLKRG